MTQVVLNIKNKKDIPFLMKLSKKFGWTATTQTKGGVDLGLEDIEAGRVFRAANADEMIAQILG